MPGDHALNAKGKWRKLTFPMDFLQTFYKLTVLASVTLVTTVVSQGCQEKVVERHETTPVDAQGWFQKGEAAMQAGDLATARSAFRHVLTLDPKAAAAYVNLGVIAMRQEASEDK